MAKLTKTRLALERTLNDSDGRPSPFELGREFFERNPRTRATRDVARHTKRLLIELCRGRSA